MALFLLSLWAVCDFQFVPMPHSTCTFGHWVFEFKMLRHIEVVMTSAKRPSPGSWSPLRFTTYDNPPLKAYTEHGMVFICSCIVVFYDYEHCQFA